MNVLSRWNRVKWSSFIRSEYKNSECVSSLRGIREISTMFGNSDGKKLNKKNLKVNQDQFGDEPLPEEWEKRHSFQDFAKLFEIPPDQPSEAELGMNIDEISDADLEKIASELDEDTNRPGVLKARGAKISGIEEDQARELTSISRTLGFQASDLPKKVDKRMKKLFQDRPLNQIVSIYGRFHDRRKQRLQALRVENEVEPIRYGWRESLAYTAYDMAPAFGLSKRVFEDSLGRIPESKKQSYKTMLDFGSGPGSATIALQKVLPGLKEALLVEPSRSMWEIATRLILGEIDYSKPLDETLENIAKQKETGIELQWCPSLPSLIQGLTEEQLPQYDIVSATFSLSELISPLARAAAIGVLYKLVRPGGMLVIAERGDDTGQEIVQEARELLLDQVRLKRAMNSSIKINPFDYDCRVVAPCTHNYPCPMLYSETRFDGCYFQQTCRRTLTKAGRRGQGLGRDKSLFKFTYVAFQKEEQPAPKFVALTDREGDKAEKEDEDKNGGDGNAEQHLDELLTSRFIRPPMIRKGHVVMDICTSNGQIERAIATKGKCKTANKKEIYRAARKAHWGGIWYEKQSVNN